MGVRGGWMISFLLLSCHLSFRVRNFFFFHFLVFVVAVVVRCPFFVILCCWKLVLLTEREREGGRKEG